MARNYRNQWSQTNTGDQEEKTLEDRYRHTYKKKKHSLSKAISSLLLSELLRLISAHKRFVTNSGLSCNIENKMAHNSKSELKKTTSWDNLFPAKNKHHTGSCDC